MFLPGVIFAFVRDSGPVYFETAQREGIIEPWNAISSIVYLIPVVWFLVKLYPKYLST